MLEDTIRFIEENRLIAIVRGIAPKKCLKQSGLGCGSLKQIFRCIWHICISCWKWKNCNYH